MNCSILWLSVHSVPIHSIYLYRIQSYPIQSLFYFRHLLPSGLRLDPLNGQCWNGLGLTLLNGRSDNSAAAAQACFVRATQIDANAPAFANLGTV